MGTYILVITIITAYLGSVDGQRTQVIFQEFDSPSACANAIDVMNHQFKDQTNVNVFCIPKGDK